MRHVFTNRMCAHVWAQQSQDHGRSGRTHFNGEVFYSYATPVARIISCASASFGRVALFTTAKYSVTTSEHIWSARRAADNFPQFFVPSLGVNAGRNVGDTDGTPDHAVNVAYMLRDYVDTLGRAKRARNHWQWHLDWAERIMRDALRYAELFGMDAPADTFATESAAIFAHHNTPEKLARRAAKEVRERINNAIVIGSE